MKASFTGVLMLSTVLVLPFGVGLGRGKCVGGLVEWVMTHCWALRHQVQIGPDGFVMAGWFLGVCHVDSGREHQPAPGLPGWVDEWGVGLCNCSVLCLCVVC